MAEIFIDPPSDAAEAAENYVTGYMYSQVAEGRRFNLLSAAIRCGCNACVSAYLGMLDLFTQGDSQVAGYIAESHGVKRKGHVYEEEGS